MKLWGELSKRTKARYAKQGVTARRYNSANKQGLRGAARLEYLGVRPGSISGASTDTARTAYNKVLPAITEFSGGVHKTGFTPNRPINTEKIEARIRKQPASVKAAMAKQGERTWSYNDWQDLLDGLDDYDSDESPLFYHD